MIGIASRSAGVLLVPKEGTGEYMVFDLVGGQEKEPVEARHLYSAVQDWEEIEGPARENLLELATSEYWLARTVSLLRLAIGGLERTLRMRVLEHVEENLACRVSPEKTLNRLLVAPLIDPRSPRALAECALSWGFSAVGNVLDELAELQPLLNRLTDAWLTLDVTVLTQFTEARETIWATLVEQCEMKQLLKAASGRDFAARWNLLPFHFPSPQSRIGVGVLGKELSRRLFREKEEEAAIFDSDTEEVEPEPQEQLEPNIDDHKSFQSAKRQIAAIAQAVSRGQDLKAERFLRDLIEQQTSVSGGASYVVKSLCNIAQQCADMFRTDFEVLCLEKAQELKPCDGWTLIQYGDHLKRIGAYDEALRVFGQAETYGESEVAKSSAADVYSQQGDYAKAIMAYKAIPKWSEKPEVLTAIADNLRKMGRLKEAEKAYNKLLESARGGLLEFRGSAIRAEAGIAEIAKQQGHLERALQIYLRLLGRYSLDERARLIYRLSLCNILKLKEEFDKAYRVVDEVIQDYPFAMHARFVRGSILGLIGRELDGLEDVPESNTCRSYLEWMRRYYRGLLLLKLDRYEDAKKNLVEELPKAIAFGQEKNILRLAAALWFLGTGEIPEADGVLSEIRAVHDCHIKYLLLVLKLHSAARKSDIDAMRVLKEGIKAAEVVDATLEKAIVALHKKDFSLALAYEADALLKLAA